MLDGQRITFDRDYPTSILKKRKEYNALKKVLSDENIKFNMRYPARLLVKYKEGNQTYETATEAAADMRKRGMRVNEVVRSETMAEKLSRTAWDLVGGPQRRRQMEKRAMETRGRLQKFAFGTATAERRGSV